MAPYSIRSATSSVFLNSWTDFEDLEQCHEMGWKSGAPAYLFALTKEHFSDSKKSQFNDPFE
jgi:hypothetical protein